MTMANNPCPPCQRTVVASTHHPVISPRRPEGGSATEGSRLTLRRFFTSLRCVQNDMAPIRPADSGFVRV
jgi:hypothetical protein